VLHWLVVAGARPTWRLEYSEGLLPGHSDLQCEQWDYDSSVIVFSYRLPEGVKPETALDTLEEQTSRGPWRQGSQPLQSCWERRVRRPGYLLTVCDNRGIGSPSAWEFVVRDSRVKVTTGGARYVVDYFLSQPLPASRHRPLSVRRTLRPECGSQTPLSGSRPRACSSGPCAAPRSSAPSGACG
jgi:hypothetical protein